MTQAPARATCSCCPAVSSSSCSCSSCAWRERPASPELARARHQERQIPLVDLLDLRLRTDRRLGHGTQCRQGAPHLADVALGFVEGVLDHRAAAGNAVLEYAIEGSDVVVDLLQVALEVL